MTGNEETGLIPRLAYLNNTIKNQELILERKYAENIVCTSKYTKSNFIPKTIFEFFRVVANIYFLVISLLQLCTPWSPTNRTTTAGPLVFVLLVTMIKQGTEDRKRHDADRIQNNRSCHIINEEGKLSKIPWQDVKVGQLICIQNNEEVCADVVILATSEEEGRCFIETSNLDGETNLKRRIAVPAVAKHAGWRPLNKPMLSKSTVFQAALQLKGSIEYEQPNNLLYNFTGRITLENDHSTSPIGPENILLRGSGLRSCSYVVGLVIFTGSETKLLQNSRPAPSKQSKVYKTANKCMGLIFATMFILCILSAIVAAIWSANNNKRIWYLPFVEANTWDTFFVNFFSFLILYNNLVPISLYVSLDIIKVLQTKALTADTNIMYDGFRAISRTSELNEELGQVEYIFSDKTGTLTRNIMEFRKCSIGGVTYGFGTTEIGRGMVSLQSQAAMTMKKIVMAQNVTKNPEISVHMENSDDISLDESRPPSLCSSIVGNTMAAQVHHDPLIHFDDPTLLQDLYAKGTKQSELIHEFLMLLATCHTVIPEVDKDTSVVTYRASSPDEEALVKAAKCLGYEFIDPAPTVKVEITRKNGTSMLDSALLMQSSSSGKQLTSISQRVSKETKVWDIMNINEFNSTRKRMSVVVKTEDGKYILYCKGADNMMIERSIRDEYSTAMENHLRLFAREGLRTLVLAKRIMNDEEYLKYNEEYILASTALEDRARKLDEVAESIEKNMTLLGVTAIEDKLQSGVPSTIYDLAKAGIKIWVLTGDREETAINVGLACRLIDDSMELLYITQNNFMATEKQLNELHSLPALQKLIINNETTSEIAMICDGSALIHLFPSPEMASRLSPLELKRVKEAGKKFLEIAKCCKAVIACRVSPSQKADIVNLVRKGRTLGAQISHQSHKDNKEILDASDFHSPHPQPITLAIGDGANDVTMIQTAHVGIGICGKEGVQAVNASDYAIAQFSFLKRLLLVHGRQNYKRICKVIHYSFYKNIALVISLFCFNFFSGQSGTPLFESFVMAGWNFFLATPIIVIGVFDEDLDDITLLKHPQVYFKSQMDSDLNLKTFAQTISNSIAHAFLVFGLCYFCYTPTHDLFVMGTLVYSALLLTMKFKVILSTSSWNMYHFLVLAFSVWLYWFFMVTYPHMTFLGFDMVGVPNYMVRQATYWLLVLLSPTLACLADFSWRTGIEQWVPSNETILREKQASKYAKLNNTLRNGITSERTLPNSYHSRNVNDAAYNLSADIHPISPNQSDTLRTVVPGSPEDLEQRRMISAAIGESVQAPGATSVTALLQQVQSSTRMSQSFNSANALAGGFAFNAPVHENKVWGDIDTEVATMRVMSANSFLLQKTNKPKPSI